MAKSRIDSEVIDVQELAEGQRRDAVSFCCSSQSKCIPIVLSWLWIQ